MVSSEKKEIRHVIFYKSIPIGEYSGASDLTLYDTADIYLDNIEKIEEIEKTDGSRNIQEDIETMMANLYEFLKGNLPGGVRFQVLAETIRSTRVLDLIKGLDEFSADISLDRADGRRFVKISPDIVGNAKVKCDIPPEDFIFHASERSSGKIPFAMAGYFDKFTAVLEEVANGLVLRHVDRDMEVGNVIIKPQGEQFPMIAVNEACCITLARLCGLNAARAWTVSSDSGLGVARHYVTERFGVRSDGEDSVSRDMIFDTGMLLAEKVSDQYSISSEKYFEFMSGVLPETEMKKFMNAYLFGYIIGNSDMHVKNFSTVYSDHGFALSPLYDLVSYKPYGIKNDLALTVGGNTYVPEEKFMKFMIDRGLEYNEILDMTAAVRGNLSHAFQMCMDPENKREAMLMKKMGEFISQRCLALEQSVFKRLETETMEVSLAKESLILEHEFLSDMERDSLENGR